MNDYHHNFSHLAFRLIFVIACVYHVAFGLAIIVGPEFWWDLCGISRPSYPALWQCLGIPFVAYGLLYWRVALQPETGRPIVAIGLLVKCLVPIGWVSFVSSGQWPLETFPLIVMNDLLWWVPFSLFLIRESQLFSKLITIVPWFTIVLLLLASPATFLVREGTRAFASEEQCIRFIETHLVLWRSTWALVAVAIVSLALLIAWWAAQLKDQKIPLIAFGIETAAIAFEFLGIALYISWLPQHFHIVDPIVVVLTAGIATTMHAIAGGLLTWATPGLPLAARATLYVTWAAGLCLSVAAWVDAHTLLIAASAVMWSLLPLTVWFVQQHFRKATNPQGP